MQKTGHFLMCSENISFLMKNVVMCFKTRTYGSPS